MNSDHVDVAEQICILIIHGGVFEEWDGRLEYVGGKLTRSEFKKGDLTYELLIAKLKNDLKLNVMKLWYCVPYLCMKKGLREINGNEDIMKLKFYALGFETFMEIFVEHGVELPSKDNPIEDDINEEDELLDITCDLQEDSKINEEVILENNEVNLDVDLGDNNEWVDLSNNEELNFLNNESVDLEINGIDLQNNEETILKDNEANFGFNGENFEMEATLDKQGGDGDADNTSEKLNLPTLMKVHQKVNIGKKIQGVEEPSLVERLDDETKWLSEVMKKDFMAMEVELGSPRASPSSPKNKYKDHDDGRQRFLLELEFVQCLANPSYIHHLAQNRYFEDEAFIGYLKYLQYWQRPEYIKFIMYPHCLFFLELLQNENFRNAMAHPANEELARRQQFNLWKNYRNNRLNHVPRRAPPEVAHAPVQQSIGATVAPKALSPMQHAMPSGSNSLSSGLDISGKIMRDA